MDSLQASCPTPVSGITSPYQGTLPSRVLVRCVMCATATWCQTLCLRRVWHKLQPPVFQPARNHSLVPALQCIFTCRSKMVVPSRQPSTFLAGTCTSPFGGSKTIFNKLVLQWPWVRSAFSMAFGATSDLGGSARGLRPGCNKSAASRASHRRQSTCPNGRTSCFLLVMYSSIYIF